MNKQKYSMTVYNNFYSSFALAVRQTDMQSDTDRKRE